MIFLLRENWKTESSTRANGLITKGKGSGAKSGPMVPFTRDYGTTIWLTDKVGSFTQVETFTKESG